MAYISYLTALIENSYDSFYLYIVPEGTVLLSSCQDSTKIILRRAFLSAYFLLVNIFLNSFPEHRYFQTHKKNCKARKFFFILHSFSKRVLITK